VFVEQFGILVDLHRQFAGRGQDQRAGLIGLTPGVGGMAQQMSKEGDQKRRGLARAGLGLAGDIPACQGERQGLGLNRGAV